MTPYGTPIVIPPEGGSFSFDVEVINYGQQEANADIWSMVTLPDGSEFGPLLGPTPVAMAPNSTLVRNRAQQVPPGAPAGDYTYHAYLGYYPATVFSQASFPFNKSGDDGSGDWLNGWTCGGDSFESPAAFRLLPAHPNPFNPTATIRFDLPQAGRVTLEVYDLLGRQVAVLVNSWKEAGLHAVKFDGSNLPSGIYVYRLQAGQFQASRKLVLVK